MGKKFRSKMSRGSIALAGVAAAMMLAATPVMAEVFLDASFVGGVMTSRPGQIGGVDYSGSGNAFVAGPRGTSVATVDLVTQGIIFGRGQLATVGAASAQQFGRNVVVSTTSMGTAFSVGGQASVFVGTAGSYQRF